MSIVFIGIIIFLSHFFLAFYIRTKVPDVLFLFVIGILIGPVFNVVQTEHFGAIGNIFTTLTLVFILFEGSMGLYMSTIRSAWLGTAKISVYNFFTTMLIVGLLGYFFSGLGLLASFMLGATVGGTSSIVVIPLVKQLTMGKTSKSILMLESAFTDLLCIVFALALLEAYKYGDFHMGSLIGSVVSSFLLGGLIGVAGALVWSYLLDKVRTIENSMFMTPAFVFVVFGFSELMGYSGAISALAFGFTLTNINLFNFKLIEKYIAEKPISLNNQEKAFQGEIVFLLKTFFFIYMGISMQFSNVWWLLIGLLIALALFFVRIFVVKFSAPSNTSRKDAILMSVIVPKGLAAAVLASIPLQQGVLGGEFIQSVTFSIIIFSILITSVLIFLLDREPAVSDFYARFLSKFQLQDDEGFDELYTPEPPEDIYKTYHRKSIKNIADRLNNSEKNQKD